MKNFSLFDPSDNTYYTIKDFIGMLTETPDDIANEFYINTKFQYKYLKTMEKLKTEGLIERKFNDNEDMIATDIEKILDVELNNVIVSLKNTVDEFSGLFKGKRIEMLDMKVNELWDIFTEKYPIEYLIGQFKNKKGENNGN